MRIGGSKLSSLYDGKRDEWINYGSDLDLGAWGGRIGLVTANLGFSMFCRLCKVWIGHFCKSYYKFCIGRKPIMGLLLVREVADCACVKCLSLPIAYARASVNDGTIHILFAG